ncbi:MAG: 3(or 17)beta-hydroxysteroid dehydrogenase [Gammaproteobacteria bacterium]|jgi:3(or 17)beta-hydroxysteroid dehydrogenase
MGRVSNKVALVTGAASGLGKADAIMLAREGAKVVLTDVSDAGADVARYIVDEIKGDAIFLHQDVREEKGWDDTISAVVKQYGGLDILVNNAGIVIVATPEQTTLEQFRFANAVMSEGVFLGCKAAIPVMKENGGGSIINMSSIASHLGFPVFFAYSAAKGAVRAMTKSIAVHCQMNRYNIRCNSIHAGSIDTPMVAQALSELGAKPPPADDPIGVGEPDDIANLVLYLASDESKFVNGAEIVIDNALSMQ